VLSHRAATKASKLRKNEPHPLGLLAAFGKLVNHLTENLVLRVQEPNEVRIGHPKNVVQPTVVFECDRLAIKLVAAWGIGLAERAAALALFDRTRIGLWAKIVWLHSVMV
jgi:hypothetical protein